MPVLNVAHIIFLKAVAMYHCSIVLIIFWELITEDSAQLTVSTRRISFSFHLHRQRTLTGMIPGMIRRWRGVREIPGGACSPIICGNVKMDSDDYQMSYLPG